MPVTAETTLAFWTIAPGIGEIRPEPLPPPTADQVLVRALYSGISRGSETLVFRGEVPASEFRRMRAPFQQGDFPGPVKYGYVSVGEVAQGPASLVGRRIFCLHPHQSRYLVPIEAVHPLPPGVPAERAVLAANMETALNGLWDATPRLGDRIAVVGGGTLGCLVAWLAGQIPGCQVTLVDHNPARKAIADALGVAFSLPQGAGEDADLVVHSSGSAAGLSTALELAGFEAQVVELSWYGTRQVAAPLGEAFHSRRITLRASQVGAVATAQRARWDRRRRMSLALSLLRAPELDHLISGEDDFHDLPQVMKDLARESSDALCHRIRYGV
jgi:threonine dehydrogenase-like Zn-dependent dehydrogenase